MSYYESFSSPTAEPLSPITNDCMLADVVQIQNRVPRSRVPHLDVGRFRAPAGEGFPGRWRRRRVGRCPLSHPRVDDRARPSARPTLHTLVVVPIILGKSESPASETIALPERPRASRSRGRELDVGRSQFLERGGALGQTGPSGVDRGPRWSANSSDGVSAALVGGIRPDVVPGVELARIGPQRAVGEQSDRPEEAKSSPSGPG